MTEEVVIICIIFLESKRFVTAKKKDLRKQVFFQWNSPYGEWNHFVMKYAKAYEICCRIWFRRRILFHIFPEENISSKLVLDFIVSFANDFILYENYK